MTVPLYREHTVQLYQQPCEWASLIFFCIAFCHSPHLVVLETLLLSGLDYKCNTSELEKLQSVCMVSYRVGQKEVYICEYVKQSSFLHYYLLITVLFSI